MSHGVFCFLLLSMAIAAAQIIKPCPIEPGPNKEIWWASISDKIQAFNRNNSQTLFYEIERGPCLELQYYGASLSSSSRLTIYGTCNYERMFRFTGQVYKGHCWLLEVSVWSKAAMSCHTLGITGSYWLNLPILMETDSRTEMHMCLANEADCMEKANSVGCLCDGSETKMADFWRGRDCQQTQQQQQKKASKWITDPGTISGLVLFVLASGLAGLALLRWATSPSEH